jgi:hypothetical protein
MPEEESAVDPVPPNVNLIVCTKPNALRTHLPPFFTTWGHPHSMHFKKQPSPACSKTQRLCWLLYACAGLHFVPLRLCMPYCLAKHKNSVGYPTPTPAAVCPVNDAVFFCLLFVCLFVCFVCFLFCFFFGFFLVSQILDNIHQFLFRIHSSFLDILLARPVTPAANSYGCIN